MGFGVECLDKLESMNCDSPAMRGTYCLIISLPSAVRTKIGSLGVCEFNPGIYVYIGSALSGIEKRVGRHKSASKKKRWHIDFLLAKAEIVGVIAIPSSEKSVECAIARLLLGCEDASITVKGFGSSDCTCDSHLVYFGDSDPEWIYEEIAMRISMFPGLCPRERSD
jgi:Uri superfamily endonuclease